MRDNLRKRGWRAHFETELPQYNEVPRTLFPHEIFAKAKIGMLPNSRPCRRDSEQIQVFDERDATASRSEVVAMIKDWMGILCHHYPGLRFTGIGYSKSEKAYKAYFRLDGTSGHDNDKTRLALSVDLVKPLRVLGIGAHVDDSGRSPVVSFSSNFLMTATDLAILRNAIDMMKNQPISQKGHAL
jgi:hypothetical protein